MRKVTILALLLTTLFVGAQISASAVSTFQTVEENSILIPPSLDNDKDGDKKKGDKECCKKEGDKDCCKDGKKECTKTDKTSKTYKTSSVTKKSSCCKKNSQNK